MKIFFSGAYRGFGDFEKQYKKIHSFLNELGYQHLDNEIVDLCYNDFLKKMAPGRKAYVTHYRQKMKGIQEADLCVFETSYHSLGIGFLIQKALEYSKPTIVLYYKDNLPYFLSGVEDEKLFVRSYNDQNVKKVLAEVLDTAREHRDKRFNFFLSPKLLDYLEHASKIDGITKSKLLRDMIVRHMRESSKEA